jgi:hypothetical protein
MLSKIQIQPQFAEGLGCRLYSKREMSTSGGKHYAPMKAKVMRGMEVEDTTKRIRVGIISNNFLCQQTE